MFEKKRILKTVLILILLSTLLMFLWPRSFLSNIAAEIKSIQIVVIETNFEHNQATHTFNIGTPEFDAIMEVLDSYSYHNLQVQFPTILGKLLISKVMMPDIG